MSLLLRAVLQKYGIRNAIWSAHGDSVSTEDSTLSGNMLDPWNRQLPPRQYWEPFYHGSGEDREIGGWKVQTSVERQPLTLTVWND